MEEQFEPKIKMIIHNDIDKLIQVFPPSLQQAFRNHPQKSQFVEIVMDLGRRPEARFFSGSEFLCEQVVSWQDLDSTTKRVGRFTNDNRAGIERSLHRISCIRNRQGIIIGLTCRIGRCMVGSIGMIRDLLHSNHSLLVLGKPGVGKTTIIREISRIFSDESQKRVVIVDTSNEIGGDSDIPHVGIGRARRLQVSPFENQHNVMIEAVENHMPQVIVVDEIGTELEALAARTIAERGVQLIGTAHGNSLESLIKNPTLSDLIGGIQSVTLSDDEARRRGKQKTVLERKSFPAFQVAIELNKKNVWTIHHSVEESVDRLLQGQPPTFQTRTLTKKGFFQIQHPKPLLPPSSFFQASSSSKKTLSFSKQFGELSPTLPSQKKKRKKRLPKSNSSGKPPRLPHPRIFKELCFYPYYLSSQKIHLVGQSLGLSLSSTKHGKEADLILASKLYFRQNQKLQQLAKDHQIPVYLINNNTLSQITNLLKYLIESNKFY
jgi:stage III sporulation protein SpoIIIAA